MVSKEYKDIIDDDKFWCQLLKRDFNLNFNKTTCKKLYTKLAAQANIFYNLDYLSSMKSVDEKIKYYPKNFIDLSHDLSLLNNMLK